MNAFLTVFVTVFLAELGDKTQLATALFSTEGGRSRMVVFPAAASALVASTGLAVAAGAAAGRWLSTPPLKLIAGAGFFAVGAPFVAESILRN